MADYRKLWRERQNELRALMMGHRDHERAITLFLSQHAMLHSTEMAQTEPWSYEDEILHDLSPEQMRRIPKNDEHSIIWILWHMARIEDVTMNLLVANSPQVLHKGNWLAKMNVSVRDTGNATTRDYILALSQVIDIEALRAYRKTVGRQTRKIAFDLGPDELRGQVKSERLQQIMDEGAVVEEARELIDYWGKRDVAGLLLMPATRHNFIHLNEAARLLRNL